MRDRDTGTLTLDQSSYVHNVIKKFEMQDAYTLSNPCDPTTRLTCETGEPLDANVPYRSAVGSLMHAAAVGTRVDIAYAVPQGSSFCSN